MLKSITFASFVIKNNDKTLIKLDFTHYSQIYVIIVNSLSISCVQKKFSKTTAMLILIIECQLFYYN